MQNQIRRRVLRRLIGSAPFAQITGSWGLNETALSPRSGLFSQPTLRDNRSYSTSVLWLFIYRLLQKWRFVWLLCIPHNFFFRCFRKAVLRDLGLLCPRHSKIGWKDVESYPCPPVSIRDGVSNLRWSFSGVSSLRLSFSGGGISSFIHILFMYTFAYNLHHEKICLWKMSGQWWHIRKQRRIIDNGICFTSIYSILSKYSMWTAKAQIRLRACAVWSRPSLSPYALFSQDVAHMKCCKFCSLLTPINWWRSEMMHYLMSFQ